MASPLAKKIAALAMRLWPRSRAPALTEQRIAETREQQIARYAAMSEAQFEIELNKMSPEEQDRVSLELMVHGLNQQTRDRREWFLELTKLSDVDRKKALKAMTPAQRQEVLAAGEAMLAEARNAPRE